MKPTVDSTTAPVEVLAGAVILILGIIVSINRCRRIKRSADSCVNCCARRCERTLRTFATGGQELDTRRLELVQPCASQFAQRRVMRYALMTVIIGQCENTDQSPMSAVPVMWLEKLW